MGSSKAKTEKKEAEKQEAKKRRESDQSEEQSVKLIKRYTNRKLYDTVESRYVTLDEIAEMIEAGEDVRIIDNRSKDDLTSVTLAQIIFEQEKKKSRMPLAVLRNIVRDGGVNFQDFFEREIQPRVLSFREGAEHTIDKVFRRDKDGELIEEGSEEHGAPGEPGAEKDDSLRERESAAMVKMLSELRDSVETWQRCLDYRLRDAAKLPVRAMNIPALRKSVGALRTKLDELERKLAEMEDDT